jgi:3-oxoacyl-ACP reductase-like protein
MGDRRGVYRVLVGKPEGVTPFGRPRRRWEYNIKMDLKAVSCEDVGWNHLARDMTIVRLRRI